MSEGRMPKFLPSDSEGFSSTPVKTSQDKDVHTAKYLDNGVVSDDEDTFSLLSPIYHDSDEEELKYTSDQQTSPRHSKDWSLWATPARYCFSSNTYLVLLLNISDCIPICLYHL